LKTSHPNLNLIKPNFNTGLVMHGITTVRPTHEQQNSLFNVT